MKKFIQNICSFFLYCLVLATISSVVYLYATGYTLKDLPAPNVSDSYSFNEKAMFIHNKLTNNETILAIGSSVTLNNLHSNTIINELKSDKFLNTGSWGLSIIDNYAFLKTLYKTYKIKQLIIASSIVDFKPPFNRIDFEFFNNYINAKKDNELSFYLKHFSFKYYFTNLSAANEGRNRKNDYHYLVFDNYGSINLNKEGFNIEKKRWEDDNVIKHPTKEAYDYLDSIANFCKKNSIEFYFFQSPIREGLYKKLDSIKMNTLNSHTQKVRQIIERNNQKYVNTLESNWPDSLFTDGIHLNNEGAKQFTQYCFDKARN